MYPKTANREIAKTDVFFSFRDQGIIMIITVLILQRELNQIRILEFLTAVRNSNNRINEREEMKI